ncbi:hypothetical protein D1818_22425 [Aquimarina sp. BL5]|uniref:hypothetical protein n=1 Tax=Aquimarina sp. BL5 TaxID=1714860 RepID=UPI000E4A7FAA|nr:hypothetical protein [Aquimarina sp. BL5]AXT53447.1 hypothetical protein D1818_22425 [Aquimarina sp. BL5]RKN08849.1 hypothetical protein D7036_04885 [Aquimarina sp. BL5]
MKNLKRYYLIAITLTVFLGSCEKENVADQVAIEESNELEADITSSDTMSKSFMISEDGKLISEEEYLKQFKQKSNSFAKSSDVYSYNIPSSDLDKLGMRHADGRAVMDRYKRNQAWLNYPNVNIYGLLVGCRPYGNSVVCSGGDQPAKWHMKRDVVGEPFMRSLGHPVGGDIVERKARPDQAVYLGGVKFFEHKSSTNKSVTNTFTTGSKIGFTASAEFFGITTGFTSEINLTHANAVTNGTTEDKTTSVPFTDGDFVPAGQRCDFQLMAEPVQTVQRYRVNITVKGRAFVRFKQTFTDAPPNYRVRDEADGAKYAFPDKERNGITSEFEVANPQFRYSIRRFNCKPL